MYSPLQTVELEEALCAHYKVSEVKCLGHGSVQTLMNKQQKGTSRDTSVVYEAAICSKARWDLLPSFDVWMFKYSDSI